jgi:membrane-bound metal-dependent hydrolase YbcI (DUF457 family)
MAQPGLHAVLALATRKTFSTQRWFALGLVFGALVPDLDGYPQAVATLAGNMDAHQAEAIFHRTLTHSLFFALFVGIAFYLVSLVRGGQDLRMFGLGATVGIAVLHIFVDIFVWFDGVGILWPLWSINLWEGISLPDSVGNLLRAANFFAFAAFFAYLAMLARRARVDLDYLPRLQIYLYAQLGLGVIFTVLAFVLSASIYNLADGAVLLLLAYPNALWVTWRMKETIEAA